MATNSTQKQAAKQFIKDWTDKGCEKGSACFHVSQMDRFLQFHNPRSP